MIKYESSCDSKYKENKSLKDPAADLQNFTRLTSIITAHSYIYLDTLKTDSTLFVTYISDATNKVFCNYWCIQIKVIIFSLAEGNSI